MAFVMRYVLDASVRVLPDEPAVIGGSPLKLFRLTKAGGQLVARVAAGADVAHTGLIDRFLDAGVIHPLPTSARYSVDDVTVVIPTRDDDVERVRAAVGAVARVVVVDDGSRTPVTAPDVIRRAVNGGPGAARNTGLASVATALVAFVDADCEPSPGWLDALLPHFADERVALVAPRVTSRPGPGTLARYETVHSPLDLGDQPARVRARTRVSYVPAACIVARAEVLRDLGGFDETMRVGEDVDLVWRADEAGYRVRYEPAAVVTHAPRADWKSWLGQRRAYGRSAAGLAERHPGAVAPLAVSGWSAATWGLVALGRPVAAVGVGGGTAVALSKKLRALSHPTEEALRLAGLGHLYAGRLIANAITRSWWPATLPIAIVSRRARRVLVAAALAPALHDWVRNRPPLDPLRYTALRLADDIAYGWGLWEGTREARRADALLPDLSSWPGAGSYERAHRHQLG
jgi:mycofactocin system glycosyltransferase